MSTRAESTARTRERVLEAARGAVREGGAAALSLRDVARRAGIVPSAVYRHVDSREDLLTELILGSYESLAANLDASDGGWVGAADALRSWALDHPHEFLLLYGTPVPGYRAPERTVGAAARVAAVFFARAGERRLPGEALSEQLAAAADEIGISPMALAAALADLAQLVGLVMLELGGHLVGTADPADQLWAAVVSRQA